MNAALDNARRPPAPPVLNEPMPLETFLCSDLLQKGDVVLESNFRKFGTHLIMLATRSPFVHSAIIYQTLDSEAGYDEPYVLESTTGIGVDITPLKSMVDADRCRTIVGIKRLEAPWFTPNLQGQPGARMLRYIKNDYDYSKAGMMALAKPIVRATYRFRNLFYGEPPSVSRFVRRIEKSIETKAKTGKQSLYIPSEFVCSGFVQYAYLELVSHLIGAGRLAVDNLHDVLFADWLTPESSIETALAISPHDLARTDKLAWKYIIHDGFVWPVSDRASAQQRVMEVLKKL